MSTQRHRHSSINVFLMSIAVILLWPAMVRAADLIRVALPNSQDAGYVPVYAAQELGYYKEKDINVEITGYRGAGPAQEAVAANAADIVNLVPTGAAVAVAKGVPEQIVACGPQVSPDGWHMLVMADGPIRSLKDLDGKKIGVSSKNSTTDAYALWAANHDNIKIETIPLGGSDWPALRGGQVQAIIRSSTLALKFISTGEARSVLDFKAVMEPNYPECWVASSESIRTRPGALRAFVEAVSRATQKLLSDENYALTMLAKVLDDKETAYLKLVYGQVVKNLTTDGHVDMGVLEASLRLGELGGLKGLPPASKLVADIGLAAAPAKH